MRYVATLSAALLFGFMVVSAPSFSQSDDHPQETRDKDRDKDKDKGNSNSRPADQDQTRRDDKETRPQENREHGNDRDARQNENRQNADRQNTDRQNDDHRGNHQEARPSGGYQGQQNGGYAQQNGQRSEGRGRGRHIPDDRFRASFGREHHFHVDRDRVYNQQQPVVVYGGYSFQLVDTWPSDWAYTDDCYIDYDDVDAQYYLYDAYHPGMRIAVFVIE